MRSFASFVARSLLASTVVLLLPGSATARGALCFDLPEASARAAERAASLPASASSPRSRCVPRPLWDLQADAARSRVASSDVGLACEPAHVAFLCAAALAPPSDPFACRLEGDEHSAPTADEGNTPAFATTTPPGPAPPAELPDHATMRRCVWPVCEALCVARAGTSPRLAAERAESNENVCSRCAAACDAEAGLSAETAAPRNEPPEYCAALRAQRRGRDRVRSERANAASDASPLGPADERGTHKNVASRTRRSNAWGCPGCDAAILSPYYHAAATAAAPISIASAVSSAASALGASSAATGAPSRVGPFRPPGAVESLAGSAAASSASAASLVASFLVVAARVAVLDAIFRAVVNSLFVVVPPGQPVPGYVYHADAAGPGGTVAEKPEARAPPGEDAETTTPATTDDPWAPWAGASLPAPPPPNPNPNPNPNPPNPSPNPPPNPSPPNGLSPAEYSSSPAPPPLGIAPPTDRCGAGGSSSAAWSCVGECAMCIFDPAASEPNCCCDEECAALGDCCADFAACCALGLEDETKTRGGRETKVLGSNLVGGFEAAFGGPRVRGGVSRRGQGGGVGGGDAVDRSRRRAAARGDAGAGEEARAEAEARGSRGGGGGSAEIVPRFAAGSRGFVSRVVVGGREATGAGRGGGGDGEEKPP